MRDRDLVRLYWPAALRPAFDALMAVDDALADVVATTSQPALGAVRLAWWREALERLDSSPPPAEPRLQAVADELLPRGVTGQDVARLEAGWATLLDEHPDPALVEQRGETLFLLAARLLGPGKAPSEAGRLYARAQLVRRRLRVPFTGSSSRMAKRIESTFRPVTALSVLAARDLRNDAKLEPEATPARALALLRHRITGRLP